MDELEQLLVGGVDREDHPVAGRLGERADALGDEVQVDVGLLERRVRGVVEQRDLLRDLEVQLARVVVVRALGHVHDALQRALLLVVEVHVKVRGVVDVPMEPVVDDLVLAERERRRGEPTARKKTAMILRTSPPISAECRVLSRARLIQHSVLSTQHFIP